MSSILITHSLTCIIEKAVATKSVQNSTGVLVKFNIKIKQKNTIWSSYEIRHKIPENALNCEGGQALFGIWDLKKLDKIVENKEIRFSLNFLWNFGIKTGILGSFPLAPPQLSIKDRVSCVCLLNFNSSYSFWVRIFISQGIIDLPKAQKMMYQIFYLGPGFCIRLTLGVKRKSFHSI